MHLGHISETGIEQKYIQGILDINLVVPLGHNVNGVEEDLQSYVTFIEDGKWKIPCLKRSKWLHCAPAHLQSI